VKNLQEGTITHPVKMMGN